MKNLNRFIQNYLLVGVPFVIVVGIWGTMQPEKEILANTSSLIRLLWEVLSWNLVVWIAVLILFLVMIVFVPSTREQVLSRVANIKERDEREEKITGIASRSVFISTLAISIFLLFVSVFTINVTRDSAELNVKGKSGVLRLGLQLNLIDESRQVTNETGVVFESKDLPLSKSAILLLLIVWQLGAFRYSSRKLSNADVE